MDTSGGRPGRCGRGRDPLTRFAWAGTARSRGDEYESLERPGRSSTCGQPVAARPTPPPAPSGPAQTYATVQAASTPPSPATPSRSIPAPTCQSAGWATINKNNLTIRGVGATPPDPRRQRQRLSSKGIFVVASGGTNLTVENLEFKNARYPTDKNGAGIRQEAPT